MSIYIELLYKSLEHPFGISVTTDDPKRLREKLYAARREAKNPDFENLSFIFGRANPATTVWIVRNSKVSD